MKNLVAFSWKFPLILTINNQVKIKKNQIKFFRKNIFDLESGLKKLDQVDCEVEHLFSYGVYSRKIFMSAGLLVIGKIHKHETINTLISGNCLVLSENGVEEKFSGDIWVSPPGAKRVVYLKTDVVWMTSHANPSNTKNLEQLESEIIAATYDDVSLPMEELMKAIEVSK